MAQSSLSGSMLASNTSGPLLSWLLLLLLPLLLPHVRATWKAVRALLGWLPVLLGAMGVTRAKFATCTHSSTTAPQG
jgi:hypothetical protein